MKEYIEVLEGCALFAGLGRQALTELLTCMGSRVLQARRGRVVLEAGTPAKTIGIVLDGAVEVVQYDLYGNRTIQALMESGDMFGESFVCTGEASLPVSVEAALDSWILMLEGDRLLRPCDKNCQSHGQVIHNLLSVLARKNMALNDKLQITSRRTIRDKLLTYLAFEAVKAGSNTFMIPFDRQQLADYLGVDRSALSAEIGRMRRDKILESDHSTFKLLNCRPVR